MRERGRRSASRDATEREPSAAELLGLAASSALPDERHPVPTTTDLVPIVGDIGKTPAPAASTSFDALVSPPPAAPAAREPAPESPSAASAFLPAAGHPSMPEPIPFPVAPAATTAPMSRRELREREGTSSRRKSRTGPARPPRPARASAPSRSRGPRPQRSVSRVRISRESIGRKLLSLGAMTFTGALAVGLSVPANAFYTASEADTGSGVAAMSTLSAPAGAEKVQELVVDDVEAAPAVRDDWTVTSWAERLQQRYGSRDYSYTVAGDGAIRWPFPHAVSITDGYGDRVSPCRGCSSYHQGVDFTPGSGAAIFAIADGVVIEHIEDNWSYGNYVIIEHQIDGQVVTSMYAHMQYGSAPMQIGDEVKVGDFVGLVGSTGASTGPHLHFEIAVDGVKVDPFAWLKVMAG